ncbi:hypothetical protein [Ammoniphilus sp. CFH 90114]|uniref:hypothetical protein n=1 Tax=Ammoniphilus sp. CFH 90114 TaxID=2493665 RepID=UPI00100FE2AE|nr:hypothetical protein [Ammoniphilus sp. CFH 90114]RXT09100.1 hypothetical protein EIZ39_10035 [Ammoniphilus sp. CFH 90114]
MTLVNVTEAFLQCEHPFYKEVEIDNSEVNCVVYSSVTSYQTTIQLPVVNFEAAMHNLSLQLIRLRSHELWNQQQNIEQQM